MPATGGTRGASTATEPGASRAVTIPNAEIDRIAYLWLERHGATAVAEARRMVAALKRDGDIASADSWLRLIVAIEQRTRW